MKKVKFNKQMQSAYELLKQQIETIKNNKLSYIDECKLKNEPVNYNLLQW